MILRKLSIEFLNNYGKLTEEAGGGKKVLNKSYLG